jgi:hypothetical protein
VRRLPWLQLLTHLHLLMHCPGHLHLPADQQHPAHSLVLHLLPAHLSVQHPARRQQLVHLLLACWPLQQPAHWVLLPPAHCPLLQMLPHSLVLCQQLPAR